MVKLHSSLDHDSSSPMQRGLYDRKESQPGENVSEEPVAKLKARNNKGIKESRSREEGSGIRHWKEKKNKNPT